MELLLVFPNLNLFSHEKKLSSSSRRTNHSDKTMNDIHSRLRYSISKGAKCSRGKAGLRDRNLGVWPNSAFIICSRASEMSGRVLIPKVQWNVLITESLLDTGWHELMALENQQGTLP